MSAGCALCGASGRVHRHHLTGRPAPGGAYLDAGLVVAVCPACHAGLHQALRTAGLDFLAGRGSLRHRLVRVAATAELVGAAGHPLVLGSVSARALGVLVLDAAGALDGEAVEG